MLELLHILLWFANRKKRNIAEETDPLREKVLHILCKGNEMNLCAAEEDRVMRTMEDAIRHFLSSPETAHITDFSFYQAPGFGSAIYAQVESRNVMGEIVMNRLVTVIDENGVSEGSLLVGFEPRELRASVCGAEPEV